MFCENCGSSVNPGNMTCPNCGIPVTDSYVTNSGSVPPKTRSLLVMSIIELIISPIFGIIALILYFTALQPAIVSGNLELAQQKKKTIKTLLTIGLIIGILLPFILLIVIMLIAVPNYSEISNNMQIRADKITASNIGKAARVWYLTAQTDNDFSELANEEDLEKGFVRLDNLKNFDAYTPTDMIPFSYRSKNGEDKTGAYYVSIINSTEDTKEKIVVAIGPENLYSTSKDDNLNEIFFQKLKEPIEVNYDGNGSGIAYIEP